MKLVGALILQHFVAIFTGHGPAHVRISTTWLNNTAVLREENGTSCSLCVITYFQG